MKKYILKIELNVDPYNDSTRGQLDLDDVPHLLRTIATRNLQVGERHALRYDDGPVVGFISLSEDPDKGDHHE